MRGANGAARRVAYVDMVGGAAGDMLLGAWVDAGVDVGELERALRTIVRDGWELTTERVVRQGVPALYLDLVIPGEDHHAHDAHGRHVRGRHQGHTLRDVLALIERSELSPRQIARASAVYRRIASAEAEAHGAGADDALFHEVGQIDAILDVAGTCVALDLFAIDELRCSPFPIGRPSAGSAALLAGFPQRPVEVGKELVTVTGAAILTTLAVEPGAPVALTVERSGYGAGRSEFPFPNVVRVEIGLTAPG
jgi:uncharacterized protein (DUF111 family)